MSYIKKKFGLLGMRGRKNDLKEVTVEGESRIKNIASSTLGQDAKMVDVSWPIHCLDNSPCVLSKKLMGIVHILNRF